MILIDRIRKLLVQPNGLTVEALQPLAEEYGIETEKANSRLSDCVQLLRKGLRAEALQLADIKPRLIDLSAVLDFPELEEWVEILKFYGIPVPTLLDRDAAHQLQEASVDEQPLDDLLRQHRRLAIAKAPLSWRLRVIRRLAKLDMKNPVWREDQRDWEVIRLKQIPSELAAAIESEDLEQVEELRSELASSEWIEKPIRELVQRAIDSQRAFRYQHQVANLTQIADRLHIAFSEGNEALCEGAHKDWNSHVAELVDPPPQALVESIEPAIEWLHERIQVRETIDEHARLCSELESMLHGDAKIAEIEQRYLDVIALQIGIPELLEQRYETKLAELRQTRRRKTQFAYFAAVSFVVGVLSVFAIWQWRKGLTESIANATKRLEELIQKEEYGAADQFISSLAAEKPEISRAAPILGLAADLDNRKAQEQSRASRVSELIAQASSDDPSRIDMGKVKQAEKEAKTPDEKYRIASLRSAFDAYSDESRRKDLESIKQAIERLEITLTDIQSRRLSDIKESDLDALLVDVKKLNNEYPRGATDAAQLISFFTQKVTSFKTSYQEKKTEIGLRQTAMNALWKSRTNVAFEAEMDKYTNLLPGDALAQEFSDAHRERNLWRAVEELNQGWSRLRNLANRSLSTKEIAEVIQILESLDKKLTLGKTPKAMVTELQPELALVGKRPDALEQLQKHLVEESVFRDLATLLLPGGKSGRRRFIPLTAKQELDSKPTSDNTKSMVTVVIGPDAETSEEEFKGRLRTSVEPRATLQSLARKLRNDQAKILDNWEANFFSLFDGIVKQPDLDHRIKELLLYQLIKAFRQASPTINQSFEPLEEMLFERANTKPWYLVGENSSEMEPVVLNRIREAQKAYQGILTNRRSALLGFSSKSIAWIGALLRDGSDEIVPFTPNASLPDGKIYTVVPSEVDPSVGRIVEIGRVQSGTVELIREKPELAPGRPLYSITNFPSKETTP
jgi:hypothetical protein